VPYVFPKNIFVFFFFFFFFFFSFSIRKSTTAVYCLYTIHFVYNRYSLLQALTPLVLQHVSWRSGKTILACPLWAPIISTSPTWPLAHSGHNNTTMHASFHLFSIVFILANRLCDHRAHLQERLGALYQIL
jgi:hypothetical protein